MKKISSLRFYLCLALSVSAASQAKAEGFSAGAVLGTMTGLSARYAVNPTSSVDAVLAYSFGRYVVVASDYLYLLAKPFGSGNELKDHLYAYAGGGVFLISATADKGREKISDDLDHDVALGLRVPLGLMFVAARAPFEAFIEFVPGVGLVPATFGYFGIGLGGRYRF